LEVFYSGDKAGNLVRVDCTGIGDLADGECVLLGREMGGDGIPCDSGDGNEGVGINSIIGMDNTWLWTASEKSSVSRWRDVGSKKLRRTKALLAAPASFLMESEVEEKKDGIEYASLVRLQSVKDEPTFGRGGIRGLGIPHSSSMSSLGAARGPIMNSLPNYQPHTLPYAAQANLTLTLTNSHSSAKSASPLATVFSRQSSAKPSALAQTHRPSNAAVSDPHTVTLTAAQAYSFRDVVPDAVPNQLAPYSVIQGDRGLLRSIILNDRVHALSVDISGEVRVWNIVRGICKGFFPAEDVLEASKGTCLQNGASSKSTSTSSNKGKRLSPRDALETVRERIEGEGVTNSWSTVDTKVGDLCVHLMERCFEAECFADEVEGAINLGGEGGEREGAPVAEDEIRGRLFEISFSEMKPDKGIYSESWALGSD
jgi:WD repeat-containing protein 48